MVEEDPGDDGKTKIAAVFFQCEDDVEDFHSRFVGPTGYHYESLPHPVSEPLRTGDRTTGRVKRTYTIQREGGGASYQCMHVTCTVRGSREATLGKMFVYSFGPKGNQTYVMLHNMLKDIRIGATNSHPQWVCWLRRPDAHGFL